MITKNISGIDLNGKNVTITIDRVEETDFELTIVKAKIADKEPFLKAGVLSCASPFKPKMKDKKFYRYVSKVEKTLYDKLKHTNENEHDKSNLYNIAIVDCLFAISAHFFYKPYIENKDQYKDITEEEKFFYDYFGDEIYSEYGLCNNLQLSNLNHLFNKLYENRNTQRICNFCFNLCDDYLKNDFYPTELIAVSKVAFEDTLLRFLSDKLIDKDIDETNYMFTFPDLLELHHIFYNYQTRLFNDICFWIIEQAITTEYNLISENDYKKIQEDIQKVVEENNKLKDKLKRCYEKSAQYLPTLKKYEKEAKLGNDKQRELFNDAITEKDREILRLEKQIETLKKKLSTISTEKNEIVDNIIEEEITENDCDATLKYTFVAIDTISIGSKIIEEFPNSMLISTYDTNLSMDTKLVVFLSSKLSHDLYFKIKNTCKAQNIPYIHTSANNINLIKKEIAKKLKK